jgi:two-component system, LuxR family, response regulator FixJ
MNTVRPIVYVVDDDRTVCQSIDFLLGVIDVDVRLYARAEHFLDNYQPGIPGCLLLDVRMPGMSGLDLQETMRQKDIDLPVIFISGHGDIPMVVRTMQKGALDFLQKPFNDQRLLDLVQEGIAIDRTRRTERREEIIAGARFELLTPRERNTLELILQGMTNKEMATTLGISPKTIETHRARIMEKMQVDSLAGLMRAWQTIERVLARREGR